ncbi:flavin reductase family protein [Streptomyces sp. NPDC058464]|uniref:flavin reductase family protein n=1 Tax=Streptomyces sp. NPDC058464 TaxID=3346511 RepID=UPI00364F0867
MSDIDSAGNRLILFHQTATKAVADKEPTMLDRGMPPTQTAPAISAEVFRTVLGHLPTGVTIVTAYGETGPVGMAMNSVTSVSLDPPLILVCPARSSSTWPDLRKSGRFCVNVMADHHEQTCRQFAGRMADRFRDVSWHRRVGGPGIDDAVAWIDVQIEEEHDAGDHTIVVARVLDIEARTDSAPLVFFQGKYGRFAA